MNSVLLPTILLLIAIFSGCSKGIKPPPVKPKPVPVQTTSSKFIFPNSAEAKNEYLAKMVTVKKGDKIEDVVQKLRGNFSTKSYETDEMDETYGTELTYIVDDSNGMH